MPAAGQIKPDHGRSSIITIDSHNSVRPDDTSSDFVVRVNPPIHNVNKMKVISASFYHNWPTFHPEFKNNMCNLTLEIPEQLHEQILEEMNEFYGYPCTFPRRKEYQLDLGGISLQSGTSGSDDEPDHYSIYSEILNLIKNESTVSDSRVIAPVDGYVESMPTSDPALDNKQIQRQLQYGMPNANGMQVDSDNYVQDANAPHFNWYQWVYEPPLTDTYRNRYYKPLNFVDCDDPRYPLGGGVSNMLWEAISLGDVGGVNFDGTQTDPLIDADLPFRIFPKHDENYTLFIRTVGDGRVYYFTKDKRWRYTKNLDSHAGIDAVLTIMKEVVEYSGLPVPIGTQILFSDVAQVGNPTHRDGYSLSKDNEDLTWNGSIHVIETGYDLGEFQPLTGARLETTIDQRIRLSPQRFGRSSQNTWAVIEARAHPPSDPADAGATTFVQPLTIPIVIPNAGILRPIPLGRGNEQPDLLGVITHRGLQISEFVMEQTALNNSIIPDYKYLNGKKTLARYLLQPAHLTTPIGECYTKAKRGELTLDIINLDQGQLRSELKSRTKLPYYIPPTACNYASYSKAGIGGPTASGVRDFTYRIRDLQMNTIEGTTLDVEFGYSFGYRNYVEYTRARYTDGTGGTRDPHAPFLGRQANVGLTAEYDATGAFTTARGNYIDASAVTNASITYPNNGQQDQIRSHNGSILSHHRMEWYGLPPNLTRARISGVARYASELYNGEHVNNGDDSTIADLVPDLHNQQWKWFSDVGDDTIRVVTPSKLLADLTPEYNMPIPAAPTEYADAVDFTQQFHLTSIPSTRMFPLPFNGWGHGWHVNMIWHFAQHQTCHSELGFSVDAISKTHNALNEGNASESTYGVNQTRSSNNNTGRTFSFYSTNPYTFWEKGELDDSKINTSRMNYDLYAVENEDNANRAFVYSVSSIRSPNAPFINYPDQVFLNTTLNVNSATSFGQHHRPSILAQLPRITDAGTLAVYNKTFFNPLYPQNVTLDELRIQLTDGRNRVLPAVDDHTKRGTSIVMEVFYDDDVGRRNR